MRITIKAQMPVIPVVSRIWVDFDAMLDNLETLNFRAFEKGLLTDTEQVKFNDTIERLRKFFLKMREKGVEVDWKEIESCLSTYEAYRYGGQKNDTEANNAITELIKKLGGVSHRNK